MGLIILLIGLIVTILPIAIVVAIILAIIKKSKEGKNNFEETIRNIYVYIILIISFIAIVTGVILIFKTGLDVLLPEKSIYETSYQSEQRQKNTNIIELYTELALVISVIPVFIYHNSIARESRKMKIEEARNQENNQEI